MNKENLSTTPENEPTNNQWEDPEIPKNMEDMPLRIDLNSEAFQSKFADAEIMAKKGTINAEQITEDGLANGAYADIYFDDADNKYKMNTYVMEGEDEDRHRRLENTHDVSPGMWIATNPKQQEADYPNSYPIEDQKFHKLYESSGDDGVYKPKGLAKLIPNDTGREVEIELPESWGGGLMSGAKDCFFRQPCDIDGNPTGRPSIIAADAVETTYGPLTEVRLDLTNESPDQRNRENGHEQDSGKHFSPAVRRFMYGVTYDELGRAAQMEQASESPDEGQFSDKTPGYFHEMVMDGKTGVAEAAWFLKNTGGRPVMNDERAADVIKQIDTLNYENGKAVSDVQHERRIIGYLLDGNGKRRDASNGYFNRDRWHNPDDVDSNAIREIVAKYPTVLDFRTAEVQLIQSLGVGSEVHAENEAKREEYRFAGRELEGIIYGKDEVERANDIMDAFAEAGFSKDGVVKMFARLPKDHYGGRDLRYCVTDDSDHLVTQLPSVRPLFEYDANLRIRPEYDSLKWHREHLLPNQ